jgi:phage regulator Rha-like protein
MKEKQDEALIPVEVIERRIYLIRGHKVTVDSDLAKLYGVPTFRMNQQVKRNRKRFPPDFMFQLNKDEASVLTSQNAMSKEGRGGRRTAPYAFTEQGVAMLSSVLNSERAIQVNAVVIRAFVRLREILATHSSRSCLKPSANSWNRSPCLRIARLGSYRTIRDKALAIAVTFAARLRCRLWMRPWPPGRTGRCLGPRHRGGGFGAARSVH